MVAQIVRDFEVALFRCFQSRVRSSAGTVAISSATFETPAIAAERISSSRALKSSGYSSQRCPARATANRGTILTTTMRSAGWHVGAAHVADGTVVATGCPSAGADLCSARASAPGPSRSRRIIRPRLASYYSTRVRGALYRCRGNACLQCPSNERMACGIDVSGPASSGWVNKSPCSFSSADPFRAE